MTFYHASVWQRCFPLRQSPKWNTCNNYEIPTKHNVFAAALVLRLFTVRLAAGHGHCDISASFSMNRTEEMEFSLALSNERKIRFGVDLTPPPALLPIKNRTKSKIAATLFCSIYHTCKCIVVALHWMTCFFFCNCNSVSLKLSEAVIVERNMEE